MASRTHENLSPTMAQVASEPCEESYDLVILGSGSTAFAAARRARELGKTAVMTEERSLGGTCVNRGCLPSKTLIEAAKLIYDAANPRYEGLTPAHIALDFPALIAQKDELIHDYRDQHYASLLNESTQVGGAPLEVVYGHAAFADPHSVVVTAPDGTTRRLRGEHFLIATGSSPAIPELPGLAETPYLTSDLLTSDEQQEMTAIPDTLLILGGGYIALELGQMFARFGSQVTILERSARILPRAEPEISSALTEILRDEGIHIITDARIRQIVGDLGTVRITAQTQGRQRTFDAAKLLVAVGRRPNTFDIGIEQAGVNVDAHGAVIVDEMLRTTMPHIWAAGDVIGHEIESQMATPVGARDGGIVATNALTDTKQRVNHSVIPRAIFTDPPVATVGLTDDEANTLGISCQCNTIPLSVVPRAGAIRDTRGLIKMVIEQNTNRILGVSMLGVGASEVIHEAAMALRFSATTDDFKDLLHVYPTMAESLKLVALSFTLDVGTLSCCAG